MKTDRMAGKLAVFALLMFGFGYVLVPIYNIFCDITGVNGKTGEIEISVAEDGLIDYGRTITVEFDTNVNSELPWRFKPKDRQMEVHPGEISEAVFVAVNLSDVAITGQAVPSVAPQQASVFFNKTECFCFTRQKLAPHETKEMIVRFVVGTDLPKKISILTLSYAFFVAEESEEVAITSQDDANKRQAI